MSEPYQDWEDLHEDIKNHAFIEYHLNSTTHSNKFMRIMNNPEKGIGVAISEKDKEKFEENREILTCIIKCFEVYGRLGIGLKDRREDSSISSFNNGNFKELPGFRANSRDNTSRKHLDAGKRNAMYTTKTTQNDFLGNMKEFIQRKIYDEVASQPYGQLFGIQIDEITDSTSIEQLGIILQYVFEGKPRESYLSTLIVIVQLAKNYAIAFSKFLKSLLQISKIADFRQ